MRRRRVPRTLLLGTGAAWLLLAIVGVGVAALGRERLLAALPPLVIDAEAVGGAITVIALAAAAIAGVHGLVLAGLARGRRWALSAGVLLASVLAVAFLGTSVAAVASAVRETALALPLLATAVVSGAAAVGYAVTVVGLVNERRSEGAV